MNEEKSTRGPDIRLNLTIFHDESQFLVEHLLALPKGAARARRMTALALIGLLAERMMMTPNVTLTQAVAFSRQGDARMKESNIREERVTTEEYRPQLTSQQLADLIGGDVASGDA
jgi:hypothetical protein